MKKQVILFCTALCAVLLSAIWITCGLALHLEPQIIAYVNIVFCAIILVTTIWQVRGVQRGKYFYPITVLAICDALSISALVMLLSFFESLQKNTVMIWVFLLLAVIIMLSAFLYYCVLKTTQREQRGGFFSTQNIVRLAVFTALSFTFYMIKFNLPFFPVWLDIQISDMPALLCGFMMGPFSGCLVIVLKILLKLPFSSTMGVGELCDLLIGVAFVLPSSFFYRYHKSIKGAIVALVLGIFTSTATSVAANYFIIIPFYINIMFGGSWNVILGMVAPLYEDVTPQNFFAYYIPLAVIPFNLLRGIVCALVTFLVYKRLKKVFDKLFALPKQEQNTTQEILENNN